MISGGFGGNLQAYTTGLPEDLITVWAVAAVPQYPATSLDATYFLAGNTGIYRKRSANDWQPFSEGLPPGLTFSAIMTNYLGSNRFLATSNGVYTQRDGSSVWELNSTGIPNDYRNILDLEFGPRDDYIFCVGANAAGLTKIFGTADAGTHWAEMTGNLPSNDPVKNIRHSGNYLYVANTQGLYRLDAH